MKASSKKIVSLGDIAKLANVSRMTVSLALRKRPEVSEATCIKIADIARKLGYAPDARMAQRMEMVRETKTRDPVPIAWLDMSHKRSTWRSSASCTPYLLGARERCMQMGYTIDEFWLGERGMTLQRLSHILYSRGIQGVIVAPPAHLALIHLKLKWEHFAAVTFEKSLTVPPLHRVAQDQYYNMSLALKLLRRFGYQRIGVVLQQQANRRSYHAVHAAALYFQAKLQSSSRIPPLTHVHADVPGAEFSKWLKRHRPEVIVGQHSLIPQWLEQEGLQVPEDIGVVHLSLDDDCLDWAGIHSRKKEIGSAAAARVISLLQNNEIGLPHIPMDTLVRGVWQHGKTLKVPRAG